MQPQTRVERSRQGACRKVSEGLQSYEVGFIVNQWIGANPDVQSSGLAWFTHDELTDFLAGDCGVPPSVRGVTQADDLSKRARLMAALECASIQHQAAILDGLLRRADLTPPPGDSFRARTKMGGWLDELRQADEHFVQLDLPVPDVAARALDAADAHMAKGEYMQAVDRIHTAVHACVQGLAIEANVDIERKKGLGEQFSAVRDQHAAFVVQDGDRATADVFKGLGRVLDGINWMRNKHSLAHPSPQPLADAEARLAVNAAKALLQYVLDRLEAHGQARTTEADPWSTDEQLDGGGLDADDLPF